MDRKRRDLMFGLGAAGLALMAGAPARSAEKVAGFAPEPWFARSTGDLNKHLAAAAAEGKYLALLWEQKGCHFCQELHAVNFQTPEIVDMGKRHFHTLQMDLWGAREFVDFDGETRPEKAIARGLSVRATPVMQFYDPAGKEVFRMPGYAPPPLFLAVYRFVAEKGYATASFNDWINAQTRK